MAGPDAIHAHRLLKNDVEGDEYIPVAQAFRDGQGTSKACRHVTAKGRPST
jgi:hypothetical protein